MTNSPYKICGIPHSWMTTTSFEWDLLCPGKQHTPAALVPVTVSREIISTYKFISNPFTHQSPWAKSSCHNLPTLSFPCLREVSSTWSSHLFVTVLAHCLMNRVKTCSYPHMRCFTILLSHDIWYHTFLCPFYTLFRFPVQACESHPSIFWIFVHQPISS